MRELLKNASAASVCPDRGRFASAGLAQDPGRPDEDSTKDRHAARAGCSAAGQRPGADAQQETAAGGDGAAPAGGRQSDRSSSAAGERKEPNGQAGGAAKLRGLQCPDCGAPLSELHGVCARCGTIVVALNGGEEAAATLDGARIGTDGVWPEPDGGGREPGCPTAAPDGARAEERTGRRYRTKGATLTSKICKIAILTALATVLLLLEFPIFPATPFYQLNFSDVPVLIGTFMFGPWIGALISTLKVLLFFFFKGTSSGFIGEISNIVGGLAYVIPAGLIYGKRHGLVRALVALIAGAVSFTVVMAFFNLFALLPWYAHRFMPELIGFRPRLILVLSWCVPFNLIKTVATGVLTFLLYKATRKVFKLF